ncbi:MAG: polysaccharide deacetylase family protein [Saprospiraceae bacterium]|nr:polysaccharide deacetylase family protein [Saprospiraceae bacterium]
MLNKPVLIGMFFMTFVVVVIGWFYPVAWWWYVLAFGTFFGSVIYGSFNINSQVFVPAVCNVPVSKNVLALTFDDGPQPDVTPRVLDILKEKNIKATFFCIGYKLEKNQAIAKRAAEEGHIIGNHSYSHSYYFDFFPKGMVRKELTKTNDLIKKITGKFPRFFRPPYGVTNFSIADAVKMEGETVIGWNIRSFDTVIKDPQRLQERILSKLAPGSILLLHDHQPALIDFLPGLLAAIEERSFEIVPLDQLIGEPAYSN